MLSVLENIHAAIKSRLPTSIEPKSRSDRLLKWARSIRREAKAMSTDQGEIAEMRRKLQEVVVEFEVRSIVYALVAYVDRSRAIGLYPHASRA
jgi:hypothetical protein